MNLMQPELKQVGQRTNPATGDITQIFDLVAQEGTYLSIEYANDQFTHLKRLRFELVIKR